MKSRATQIAVPNRLRAIFFDLPNDKSQIARDFKWLGSYRYRILHLGGRDENDLRERCERASGIFGWDVPYASGHGYE